jgi:hypothetical protein
VSVELYGINLPSALNLTKKTVDEVRLYLYRALDEGCSKPNSQ